jgi:hypothetical protein
MEKYQIYRIESSQIIPDKEIDDGMLRKSWYRHPELGECLFKRYSIVLLGYILMLLEFGREN